MGFFTTSQLRKLAKQEIDPESLVSNCTKCGAYKDSRTKKAGVSGEGAKKILIVGDYPSDEDDYNCIQFSDETGKYLSSMFRRFGMTMNRDCWKVNAFRCVPQCDPDLLTKHVKLCKSALEKDLIKLKPDYVLLMGSPAVAAVFGDDFSNCGINRWRGFFVKDQKFKTTFFATFHPREYVIENTHNKNLQSVVERDLKKFFSAVISKREKYEEPPDYEKYVKILTDYKAVEHLFNQILIQKKPVFFDYETTGLKPFKFGHKIVMVGVALTETQAYAIPIRWKNHWNRAELNNIEILFNKILADPKIPKSAQNIKFEDNWSAIRMNTQIKNVEWCTQMGSHILDNRRTWNGLKFQTFINFGIRPYDKDIKHFLESNGEEFNTIEKAPFKDLAVYCGLDCIFGLKLKHIQQHELSTRKGQLHAFNFFKKGLGVMSEMQLNGVHAKEDYYIMHSNNLEKTIETLTEELTHTSSEAKLFKDKYKRDINLTSNDDLGKLYFEILGHKGMKTAKGNWKTDKIALSRIRIPFSKKLLEIKRLNKLYDTYVSQYKREIFQDKIHTFFDLHIPISYRSSSSLPNMHNNPKRDADSMALVRGGITPSPGCVLIEGDFSGAEVITGVCYHKDKNFYNYLIDTSTDMHRDSACDLFMLRAEDMNHPDFTKDMFKMAKKIRNAAKNKWVFAQFYGDWFDSCGRALYEECYKVPMFLPNGILLSEHMDEVGIGELEDFLEHCKEVERILWYERFPEYTKWKKDIVDFYQRNGFIETFLGFRFQGYMDRKQCTNFPIQGTSFHLLVHTLIEVSRFIKRHKLKTKLVMQIHDSCIADVPLDEVTFYLNGVNSIVSNLHKMYKWLIVPMKIEAEVSRPFEDDGNFSKMYAIPDEMLSTKVNLKSIYDKK